MERRVGRPGAQCLEEWGSMVLGVAPTSTLCPHKNPKKQVILTHDGAGACGAG